jgi:hypothetical protein|tara:strand:+ start:51 stop:296 length:246 start_codon:yes stop_codon:yes gene_type:complete
MTDTEKLIVKMVDDLTRMEGTEMAKRPKWDNGSSLWDQPTYLVEEYIDSLEEKIVEQGKVITKYEERDRLTDLWARGEIEN